MEPILNLSLDFDLNFYRKLSLRDKYVEFQLKFDFNSSHVQL